MTHQMTIQTMEAQLDTNAYDGPNARDFYGDLINLFELEDNEISHKMYILAWKNGHAAGHREVYYYFMDLVEVFKK